SVKSEKLTCPHFGVGGSVLSVLAGCNFQPGGRSLAASSTLRAAAWSAGAIAFRGARPAQAPAAATAARTPSAKIDQAVRASRMEPGSIVLHFVSPRGLRPRAPDFEGSSESVTRVAPDCADFPRSRPPPPRRS